MGEIKKVVISRRFGGFSLSPTAVRRLAELNGRACYFYGGGLNEPYREITEAEAAARSLFWTAFDVPNISDVKEVEGEGWWDAHYLDSSPEDRADPKLIQVVEELGEAANGACAALEIVEIPADVEFVIDEYDGYEHVAEKHRTWP